MSETQSTQSMSATGKTVLVTGGAGFIGSHLVEELVRREAAVTVVDDFSKGRRSHLAAVEEQIEIVSMDLRRADLDGLLADRPFDVAFHLAGSADVRASVENPADDLETNGTMPFRLLEAIRRVSPSTRLVFSSSAAVYGEAGDAALGEAHPTVPVAPYGVSKLMAERYLAVYARLYGLRTVSLRLFPVYGPRLRSHVVYDLMAKVTRDPETLEILGDGSQVRDFTYVSDVVAGMLLVVDRAPCRGEALNLASDEPLSITELAEAVCVALGERPRLCYSGAESAGVSRRWTADISRLRGLGFEPRIRLEAGLAETARWFRRERAEQAAAADT